MSRAAMSRAAMSRAAMSRAAMSRDAMSRESQYQGLGKHLGLVDRGVKEQLDLHSKADSFGDNPDHAITPRSPCNVDVTRATWT